jgi:hypothetical protein
MFAKHLRLVVQKFGLAVGHEQSNWVPDAQLLHWSAQKVLSSPAMPLFGQLTGLVKHDDGVVEQ